MGFQFNHVGGGTKTRRPINLEMRYDPKCREPKCELANEAEDNQFEEVSLEELQAHIASQNEALQDRETFSEKDIIVRMHFEFSPNLTIIDTPGMYCTSTVGDSVWYLPPASFTSVSIRLSVRGRNVCSLCI